MTKRILALTLCLMMFACLLPSSAFAAEDYDTVTIKEGDTVLKLLEANGRDYDTDKYIVMVLNGMYKEKQMEVLSIGDTIKIPKAPEDIVGDAPHLISALDTIEYYVIPYKILKGDTIKNIYKLWALPYNDYAEAIRSLNPGKNLDKIYVGDIVYLPTTADNLPTKTYTTVMSHIMLEDETVESVFSRYNYDFEENEEKLQTYNTIPFYAMRAGDKLLIPLNLT